MHQVQEDTTFIGVSELRKESRKLLQEMQKHKVILTKRSKPVGVLINYEQYRRWEEIIDALESAALEQEVLRRVKRKNRKYISLEEMERRVGLK